MAELVDALGSGPSGGNTVEVRVLFWAPFIISRQIAASSILIIKSAQFFGRLKRAAQSIQLYS